MNEKIQIITNKLNTNVNKSVVVINISATLSSGKKIIKSKAMAIELQGMLCNR